MQNLEYNWLKDKEFRLMSLKLKTIRNINSSVGYIMSLLYIIAWIELLRFCIDLYYLFH